MQLNKLFVDIHINKDTPQQEVIERILEWSSVGFLFQIRPRSQFR